MTTTERDIRSAPDTLRRALERVEGQRGRWEQLLTGPVLFIGSGSSHCVGAVAAYLYEQARTMPAQAVLAPDYLPRPGWQHVAVSRTGRTTELLDAMHLARAMGAALGLVLGETDSPAEPLADPVLPLEFAVDEALVQTRFILAAMLAVRLLVAEADERRSLEAVPDEVQRALEYDPTPLLSYERVVFLGRGWRQGIARSAALTVQESSLVPAEAYHTLDYRHGPIACADADTLVWCFDAPDDVDSASVLADVRRTGASVHCIPGDPLAGLAQAQLFAVAKAESLGVNPDAPRYLTRAIVLPER